MASGTLHGAALDFSVASAWYQTRFFSLLCIALGAFIIWTLYRLRVGQIASAMSARFDERLAERTRLAREIHDTLLQTIQGSKMVADDALDQPTDTARMHHALERLSKWLGQATMEGRAALNVLRDSTTQRNDLSDGLRRATEDAFVPSSMRVAFAVNGEPGEMHPIVRDEVYRIGYEAIRNACIHSEGSRLEIEISYAQDLALRVADNGKGLDPSFIAQGKEGHFGLQGMRERAARVGGRLTLTSSPTSGTEIRLSVPGKIVFRNSRSNRQIVAARIRGLFTRA